MKLLWQMLRKVILWTSLSTSIDCRIEVMVEA